MSNKPNFHKPLPSVDAFEAAFEDLALSGDPSTDFDEQVFSDDYLILNSPAKLPENPTNEPEIQLSIDMGEGDWDAFCEKAGIPDRAEAIGRVFDYLDIYNIFDGITEVCGKDAMKKLRRLTLEVIPEVSGACAAFAATIGDISFEYINGRPQPVLKFMEFSGQSRIVLPILNAATFEPNQIARLRETITEEILHTLMQGSPNNEFLDEGLAGAAMNLMIERGYLHKSRYVSGVNLISGFENSGLNPGDGRAAHENSMHNLVSAAGTIAILDCLGRDQKEVSANFKLLFKVCQSNNKGIKYNEWIASVENLIPGFKSRFECHKFNRPLESGAKIAYVRLGVLGEIVKDSGELHVFNYQVNPNFNKAKFEIPNNIEPNLHHFDFEPGRALFPAFALSIRNQKGESIILDFKEKEERGLVHLSSKKLGEIFKIITEENNPDAKKFTGRKVTLSVSVDDDNWFGVGKVFSIPRVEK